MTIKWVPTIERQGRPIYLDIVAAMENDIRDGRLKPGMRLPSHRALAERLGIALGTVTRAYQEALRRGLVCSSGRRGTFIGESRQPSGNPPGESPMVHNAIDLCNNYPASIVDPDPTAALRGMSEYPHNRHLMRYTSARGYLRHRMAGAEWIRMLGLDVSPDGVMPTNGAQQALVAILATVAELGDTIATDRMTYPGLITLCRVLGLKLVPIASDADGIVPEDFDAVCRTHSPKAVYLVPTLNNPTNTILPTGRRRDIADTADRHGVYIIEDDIYRALVASPPELLASLSPERCFFIASASKLVAGGLRVAFVVPPPAMMQKLVEMQWIMSLMVSPVTLEIFARWVEDGTIASIIDARRADAEQRQALARSILGDHGSFTETISYNIWLTLPDNWTSDAFVTEAQRRDVLVSPSHLFAVSGAQDKAVRICLAAASDHAQLRSALETIAEILRGDATGATGGLAV